MSDKPLAERLQVKHGRRIAIVGAPDGFDALVGTPPPRADIADAEVVLLFVANRAALKSRLAALPPRLRADAILWLAYPKRTSPHAADLSRDVVRAAAPAFGLDTVSQIALNGDWSALRLKPVP